MEPIVIWFLFGVVSAVVAANKGRNGCGWFLIGVILGPFGFILALVAARNERKLERDALARGDMKKCPHCAEMIRAEAVKCRYCGERV